MDTLQAIHQRRTIRLYQQRPVPRPLVEELCWAAVQAPTPPASGERPWAIVVLEGAARLAALGEQAKAYAREHQPPGRPWHWAERPDFRVFWNAPLAVVLCAESGNAEAPFDCCRAAQNLMLAACASGLGSAWVGAPLPWLRDPAIAHDLGLPAGYDAAAVILLGWAAEQPAGQPRPRPPVRWLD